MRITDDFVFFSSYKDIYSSHYKSDFHVAKYPEVFFPTVEHYMMYEKAMLFGDEETANKIMKAWHPHDAKKLGRKVKGFDNEVWDAAKKNIVITGILAKMAYNQDITREACMHFHAGKKFVEATPNKIWGVGLAEDDDRILDPVNWRGQNLHGDCWEAALSRIPVV